jgi:diguanylate cyclase (GGDEF)-like protein
MKKFILETGKNFRTLLQVDIAKYALAGAIGFLLLWVISTIGFANSFGNNPVKISSLGFVVIVFITTILSSAITFFFQNKKYQKLEQDSLTDELTGLYNHKSFYTKLTEAIKKSQEAKTPLSLMIIDIDDFKRINDSYLLKGGDHVIKQVSKYLSETLRASDIIFRQHYRGDEFVVIANKTNKLQAAIASERIRDKISQKNFTIDKSVSIKITVSCGVAEYIHGVDTIENLFDRANKAMLTAKTTGKNKSVACQGI